MIDVEINVNAEAVRDLVRGKLTEFAREFVQDLGQAVVENTPVKTGFLRSSWFANINGGTGATPVVGTSLVGGGAGDPLVSLNAAVTELELGDSFYMSNGAAYAMRVEYGFVGTDSLGRKYNQPPRSFVRGTLDRAESIATAAAERVAGRD